VLVLMDLLDVGDGDGFIVCLKRRDRRRAYTPSAVPQAENVVWCGGLWLGEGVYWSLLVVDGWIGGSLSLLTYLIPLPIYGALLFIFTYVVYLSSICCIVRFCYWNLLGLALI
jgi:hypothetical protein